MPFALAICGALVLLTAFEWTFIDWLTPFLFMPLIGMAWLIFAVAATMGAARWVRRRGEGFKAGTPFLLCMATLAIVLWVPFTDLWLWGNFQMKTADRETVVREIVSGHLRPNVPHNQHLIALGAGSHLSSGGNEVLVDVRAGKTYVLFFTYRGILDSYSGFLFVPEGGTSRALHEMNDKTARFTKFSERWYFVSHS